MRKQDRINLIRNLKCQALQTGNFEKACKYRKMENKLLGETRRSIVDITQGPPNAHLLTTDYGAYIKNTYLPELFKKYGWEPLKTEIL